MSSERRKFRPYDIPVALSRFLDDARLLVGGDPGVYVEAASRRLVGESELRSGKFSLEITRDDESFSTRRDQALESMSEDYPPDSLGLVVVVGSSYLKLAQVAILRPLEEAERVIPITEGVPPRPFQAIFHGCEIEAAIVLLNDLPSVPLRPSRKGTWLGRARFELRTGLDGVGFNVLPLTDDVRAEHKLPRKTLRYVDLNVSPRELAASSSINLYVDPDLLARLKREPSRSWAVAFSDQLALDVLSALALSAVADPSIHEMEWTGVEDSLLGALIAMVDGNAKGDEAEIAHRRQELLEELRGRPNRFLALIEDVVEMRDNVERIVGG